MSIWDHIRPASADPAVSDASLIDHGQKLRLSWDDGKNTDVSSRALRQQCPCATCVDEWTHQRTFDPAIVKPDMKVTGITPVGNYALKLAFADGHSTGIFPWKLLRELSTARG